MELVVLYSLLIVHQRIKLRWGGLRWVRSKLKSSPVRKVNNPLNVYSGGKWTQRRLESCIQMSEGLLCGKEELDLFDVISLEKKGTYFCARSFMFTILGFSVSCEDLGYPQGPPGWDRGCLAGRV